MTDKRLSDLTIKEYAMLTDYISELLQSLEKAQAELQRAIERAEEQDKQIEQRQKQAEERARDLYVNVYRETQKLLEEFSHVYDTLAVIKDQLNRLQKYDQNLMQTFSTYNSRMESLLKKAEESLYKATTNLENAYAGHYSKLAKSLEKEKQSFEEKLKGVLYTATGIVVVVIIFFIASLAFTGYKLYTLEKELRETKALTRELLQRLPPPQQRTLKGR